MSPVVAIVEYAIVALIGIGTFFVLVGSIGLVKLSDFFLRVHGPTKATTLGVGCVLIASIADHAIRGEGFGFRELLVTLFLFITAPVSAHLVSRAALKLAPRQRPPLPAPGDALTAPAPTDAAPAVPRAPNPGA